jgi:hypothetical protein
LNLDCLHMIGSEAGPEPGGAQTFRWGTSYPIRVVQGQGE